MEQSCMYKKMYVLLHVSTDFVSKRGSSHVYTSMCYYMLVLIWSSKRERSHVYTSMCYYMLVLMSLREGAVMYILVCVITC